MKSSYLGTNTVNRKIKQYIYSMYPSNIHIINYTQSNNSWSKRICCINFKVVILYIYSQIIKPINIYCTVHILSVNQFSLFLVYFLAMKAATYPNPEILGTGCVYTNQNQLMISIFPRFFVLWLAHFLSTVFWLRGTTPNNIHTIHNMKPTNQTNLTLENVT